MHAMNTPGKDGFVSVSPDTLTTLVISVHKPDGTVTSIEMDHEQVSALTLSFALTVEEQARALGR